MSIVEEEDQKQKQQQQQQQPHSYKIQLNSNGDCDSIQLESAARIECHTNTLNLVQIIHKDTANKKNEHPNK